MKKLLMVVAVSVAFGVFADTYYVDSNQETEGDGSKLNPFKTLAKAMEGRVSGDIVYAAAGTYAEGAALGGSNTTSNRVVVPTGVALIGEGADVTFIEGHLSDQDTTTGCGTDAIRCAYVSGTGYIKGFTLRNGRTQKDGTSYASQCCGGGLTGGGLAVECVFSGNGCGGRGIAVYDSNAIRCRFEENTVGSYLAYAGCRLVSCVIAQNGSIYSGCSAYNCTFTGGAYMRGCSAYDSFFIGNGTAQNDQNNASYFNCVSRTTFKTDKCNPDADCVPSAPVAGSAYDATTYRPDADSELLVDKGKYWANATNGWCAAWQAEASVDFAGGVRWIGAATDIGAGEYDWREIPESSGLTVSVGKDEAGDVITVSRNGKSDHCCLGFVFNGETVMFPEDGDTRTKTVADWTKCSAPVPFYSNVFYVDIENGDDVNNNGFTAKTAKKTIPGALAIAALTSGDIIRCAPGVYGAANGVMNDGTCDNRVYVTMAGIGIESAEGPEKTIIQGAFADTDSKCGEGAVRCVKITGDGSYVKGFTLTGGATTSTASGSSHSDGGGFWGVDTEKAYAAAIDCIITNNACAYRGGGVYAGVIIGSYIGGNMAGNNASGAYYGTRLHNCVAVDYVYYKTYAYNSLFTGTRYRVGSVDCIQRNSIFLLSSGLDDGKASLTNCILTAAKTDGLVDLGGTVFDSDLSIADLDATTYRPVTERALALLRDKVGDDSSWLVELPYYASFGKFLDKDYADGQRVYNGKVDIGPGEYDWRGDFAKTLAKKNVAVEVASAGVTTNEVAGLVLADGETLTVKCTLKVDGKASFRVVTDGEGGTVTVMFGKTELTPIENVYTFDGTVGENVVKISFAGDGKATVSEFTLPGPGLMLLFR